MQVPGGAVPKPGGSCLPTDSGGGVVAVTWQQPGWQDQLSGSVCVGCDMEKGWGRRDPQNS